ncbi:2-nitropropane dioxygenase [Hysterangium stoloniferum]|nr:2-nitropropane dioxygenase [Hysterangium stoloniferum]
MQRINTPLTDLLGIDCPIVCAPMTGFAGGDLASEVMLGGGFAFAAPDFGPAYKEELDIVKARLSVQDDAPLPIGVGFLGFLLDKSKDVVDALNHALERRVRCVFLAFGADLGKWANYVRKYDQARTIPHTTLLWICVNSVAEAERATNEWKADVLVVQGIEAGGHGHSQALPLITLLPLIKQSLPNPPPLVAAGGLVNGAQVAAVLILGASGAVLGTRFLATPESKYAAEFKSALLSATSTVRTFVFDEVASVTWPVGIDGRVLPNQTLIDDAMGLPLEERKKTYAEAAKTHDVAYAAVWAGSSVALVNELVGARTLTQTIHSEIVEHLRQTSTLLGRKP